MENAEREWLVDQLALVATSLKKERLSGTEKQLALVMLENVIWKLEPRTPTGKRIRDMR